MSVLGWLIWSYGLRNLMLPLAGELFVTVAIKGFSLPNAAVIPRSSFALQ